MTHHERISGLVQSIETLMVLANPSRELQVTMRRLAEAKTWLQTHPEPTDDDLDQLATPVTEDGTLQGIFDEVVR